MDEVELPAEVVAKIEDDVARYRAMRMTAAKKKLVASRVKQGKRDAKDALRPTFAEFISSLRAYASGGPPLEKGRQWDVYVSIDRLIGEIEPDWELDWRLSNEEYNKQHDEWSAQWKELNPVLHKFRSLKARERARFAVDYIEANQIDESKIATRFRPS